MASTYYLGTTASGRLCSRKSNRADFTHAAIHPNASKSTLASFGTSLHGAFKNATQYSSQPQEFEVCELRQVTAKEFKAAVDAFKAGA